MMTRPGSILAVALLMALPVPPATARPLVVAPPGSHANADIQMTTNAAGRALVSWLAGASPLRAMVAVRTASGQLLAPLLPLPGFDVRATPFAFPGPAEDTVIASASASDYRSSDVLAATRPLTGGPFGKPRPIVHGGSRIDIVHAAANKHGAAAVLVRGPGLDVALLTKTTAGRWSGPEPLAEAEPKGPAAVAVGPTGKVVVAYTARTRAVVQVGQVGTALGGQRVLGSGHRWLYPATAIDDRGTMTVAFVRFDTNRTVDSYRASIVAARAARGSAFGPLIVLGRDAEPQPLDAAAAGSTTAVTWTRWWGALGVRVAVARGRRGFSVVSPAARPHGRGGRPQAALLPDRTPLVVFSDRDAVYLGDPRTGAPVDRTPPRATMTPLDPAELRRNGRITTRVSCSQACSIEVRLKITTGWGPTVVITRRQDPRRNIRAGQIVTLQLDVKRASRPSLDAGAYARAIARVIVSNASGVSRELREVAQFACPWFPPSREDCPPAPAV